MSDSIATLILKHDTSQITNNNNNKSAIDA